MKSGKNNKITDGMIGADDKLCSCASEVIDILISHRKNKKGRTSLRKIMNSLRKEKKATKSKNK